jgi:CRP-like cAMP-binding protein
LKEVRLSFPGRWLSESKGFSKEAVMSTGALGKTYQDGDVIIRQGEVGDCMYVIQEGQVEIILESQGKEIQLQVHGPGAFFGEMAIFDKPKC